MIDMCFRLLGRINRKTWWKAQGTLLAAARRICGRGNADRGKPSLPECERSGGFRTACDDVRRLLADVLSGLCGQRETRPRPQQVCILCGHHLDAGRTAVLVTSNRDGWSAQVWSTTTAGDLAVFIRHVDGGTWPSGRNGRPQWLWRRASVSGSHSPPGEKLHNRYRQQTGG
jgi:hypothetical protein